MTLDAGDPIRILFLADTHLGFDLPLRPRIERPRRGNDFLANYRMALTAALEEKVDLVVHGGDVFDRPGVISTLAYQAFEPLIRIADRGIPVAIVPGNHERSRLPHLRFAKHPLIHIFDSPRTFELSIRGCRLALAGFPYHRRDVRSEFAGTLEATGWRACQADHRLLCIHHCVEGATVGPADYTFRSAPDVIRPDQVPPEFSAVLSGHIHRHQVLTRRLNGKPLAVPVLYAGSIERTAAAEIGEPKGYLMLTLDRRAKGLQWEFRPLYARPMIAKRLAMDGQSAAALEGEVLAIIAAAPADAVLSIRIDGEATDGHRRRLTARRLRAASPPTMNVDLRIGPVRFSPRERQSRRGPPASDQLSLY